MTNLTLTLLKITCHINFSCRKTMYLAAACPRALPEKRSEALRSVRVKQKRDTLNRHIRCSIPQLLLVRDINLPRKSSVERASGRSSLAIDGRIGL